MDVKDITERVMNVLKKICYNSDMITQENMDESLTGTKMGFADYDMVYVVLELMEEFKISFLKEDFENYKFNTINGICDVVKGRLNV